MKSAKKITLAMAVYIALCIVFYWIVMPSWKTTGVSTQGVTQSGVAVCDKGEKMVQTCSISSTTLNTITLYPQSMGEEGVKVTITVNDEGGSIFSSEFAEGEIPFGEPWQIEITPAANLTSQNISIIVENTGDGEIAFLSGNTKSAGKVEVKDISGDTLTIGGIKADYLLKMELTGQLLHSPALPYLISTTVIGIVILALMVWTALCRKNGRGNLFITFSTMVTRYKYLLKQLVLRDFKVKYKSSVLGVFWSFLNPLMTMIVYYVVFSMVFKSEIPNFPVYLITGVVLFNYFSEATNLGMLSIVGNVALITKVYIPKYIFPLSKALSSAVNMVISMIPLMAVMVITGCRFTKAMLLIPVALAFLIMFSVGMSMMLSALNVFFRDIQFLWSVLLTMWNFLTPIFYPISIIPQKFMGIYQLNPMTQFVQFMRTITIDGVAPTPEKFLMCFLCAVIPFLLGVLVFRKTQDKFVLHL